MFNAHSCLRLSLSIYPEQALEADWLCVGCGHIILLLSDSVWKPSMANCDQIVHLRLVVLCPVTNGLVNITLPSRLSGELSHHHKYPRSHFISFSYSRPEISRSPTVILGFGNIVICLWRILEFKVRWQYPRGSENHTIMSNLNPVSVLLPMEKPLVFSPVR